MKELINKFNNDPLYLVRCVVAQQTRIASEDRIPFSYIKVLPWMHKARLKRAGL